jgi:hypothetical protein
MYEIQMKESDSWTSAEIRQLTNISPAYGASMLIEGKNIVSVEFEPGIASILMAIGGAIIGQLGAKAAADQLASTEDRIEEMIRALGDIIRSAIDASVIARLTSEIRGLNRLIAEYVNNPAGSESRLNECINKSSTTLVELENYLPQAGFSYHYGVLLRLSALQEKAIRENSEGERTNVRNFARESIPKLNDLARIALERNPNRVTGISEKYKWTRPDRGSDGDGYLRYSANYSVDGQNKAIETSGAMDEKWARKTAETHRNKLEAQRQQDIVRVRDDFMARAGIPLANSIQNIEAIAGLR